MKTIQWNLTLQDKFHWFILIRKKVRWWLINKAEAIYLQNLYTCCVILRCHQYSNKAQRGWITLRLKLELLGAFCFWNYTLTYILTQFFDTLPLRQNILFFSISQYNCSHRVPYRAICVTTNVRDLGATRTPHLNPWDRLLLVGVLRVKLYSNNPRTEENLKENIQNVVLSFSPAKLRSTMKKVFLRRDAFLRVKCCFNAFQCGQ